jgi:CheY-like chemotaxis protein
VADTGQGMDEATLARATEPFFTTKGVGKGTGLGLSMIHGFAEQIGGSFELESEPGSGTAAHLRLPVAESGTPEPAARSDDADELVICRPLVVLAVDDDPLVLMNTVAMLEDQGHKVVEAASGEEALGLFAATPGIDLIITDQAMPAMTGIELVRAVRERRPALPAVIATGYGELPEADALDYRRLGKPFGAGQLAKAVLEATAERPA